MVSSITCNSDAGGFIRHKYTFFSFSYSIITNWVQLFPSQKMTSDVTTAAQIPSKFYMPLLWLSWITSLDSLQNHWFAYGFSQPCRGNFPFDLSGAHVQNDWAELQPMGNSNVDICMRGWMDGSADGYCLYVPLFHCSIALVGTKKPYSARLYFQVLHSHTLVFTPAYSEKQKSLTGLQGRRLKKHPSLKVTLSHFGQIYWHYAKTLCLWTSETLPALEFDNRIKVSL